MKRRILWSRACILFCVVLLLQNCTSKQEHKLTEQEVALEWARMTLFITRFTPANSPTFASRGFGYIGLTMYEAIVNGDDSYLSMGGKLNGLDQLPVPDSALSYNWPLSLNASQAFILKNIYQQTSDENKARIDSLETAIKNQFSNGLANEEIERSITYGKAIASKIYEWSKSDGGHRGYLNNFDKEAVHPERPGSWKPPLFAQSFSHLPLHPHWGENRTFIKENAEIPIPDMVPYDTMPDSPYYNEFMQVYKKDMELSQEEKEAAIWWGDDPDVTFTPPGHSYYFATLAVDKTRPPLIECAAVFAKMGMATADAFIQCWKWKYHYFSERPNTFIPQFIDQEWESFWPDPPFPSFPSGHAIQAAAAATVLEDAFGNPFEFTDRAHENRPRDEVRETDFVVRSFKTFWEAAQETADSRFYGGIHTPQDNAVGLEEGSRIAKHVISLKWKN